MSEPQIRPWLPEETTTVPPWESLGEAFHDLPKTLDQLWEETLGKLPDHVLVQSDRGYGNKIAMMRDVSWWMNSKLERQADTNELIDWVLQAIQAAIKEVGPANSSSEHDQQWNAYFQEIRRCQLATTQYHFLRRFNTYIETIKPLGAATDFSTYFDTLQTSLTSAAERLIVDQAGITNPETFRKIKRVGEPIDLEGERPITPEQLVYVRAMSDHVPLVQDNSLVMTTPYQAGVSNRNSIHGSINHLVEAHTQASWQNAQGITLLPMASLIEQQRPTNVSEVDTYFFGEVALTWPEGSIILVQQGAEQWETLLAAHPELEERYTILRVRDREAMRTASHLAIERQGYSVIPGGDHQSSDRKIAKKMHEFRQTFPTTEGGLSHFYAAADRIDMAHGAIMLERIKAQAANPENWIAETDWINNTQAKGQLAELVNAADTFLNTVGSVDFSAYNLPEERRKQLLKALTNVLAEAPDPKTPAATMDAELDAVRGNPVLYAQQDAREKLWRVSQKIHRHYYQLTDSVSPEAPATLARIDAALDVSAKARLSTWTEEDEMRAIFG